MDDFLENIDSVSIDGKSRSARWKNLRGHLKQVIRLADENSDRLGALETELAQIREANLKLTEVVQVLSDLANEEVQREISLTLNDTEYDIVVDVAPEPQRMLESEVAVTVDETLSLVDLQKGLRKLPRVGGKTAEEIAAYVQEAGEEKANHFATALLDVIEESERRAVTQPSLLEFEN